MTRAESAARRALWRWLGWFAAANAGLYTLVSLRYLLGYPWPESAAGLVYVPLALIGQCTLLAVLPPVLLLGPVIAIRSLRRTAMAGAAFLAALALALLVLDANVFAERRLHLSLLIARIFDPATWIASAVLLAIALAFEALLARMLWRWLKKRRRPAGGRWLAAALALVWLAAQGMHVWADAVADSTVTRLTSYLPFYYPMIGKRLLARLGLVDPARVQQAILERRAAGSGGNGDLRYPLAPLRCGPAPGARLNVLWVVIDALRPDAVDAALMPTLTSMRRQSQVFDNHWSGGNSSRMGAFSMFYGLPPNYFQSFYSAQRAPVLMEEFRAQGYDMLAISTGGFGSPTLADRTAVVNVPTQVSTADQGPLERGPAVTRRFERWLLARTAAAPFFALLWYSPPIAKTPPVEGLAPDARYVGDARADELWNGYRRAMHRTDRELLRLLGLLSAQGLAANTLVIVASDHGYEFDDLGLGYYGHAGNYGAPQLRSVLLLRWPGREPRAWSHRSSHYDLPPTLLTDLLGCANPPGDYSLGGSLFDGASWDWLPAGSYHTHAIVEPDRILVTYPGGLTETLGPDMRPAVDDAVDAAVIEDALAAMRRFYR